MESRPNFKEMTTKKKIEYIWDYYKVIILCSIFAIYAIGSAIYNHVTEKECMLKLIMINGNIPYDGAIFADDFLQEQELNPETQEIVVSSIGLGLTNETYQEDYNTTQALIVRLTSGNIDIMSAPSEIYKDYAKEGYYHNLNDIFTPDELARYEDLLVFTTDSVTNETYPCGFDLSNSTWIDKYGYYSGDCQFGIIYNCTHIELAREFLLFVLNY